MEEWIQCSESMPDENEWVLITVNTGLLFGLSIARFNGKEWEDSDYAYNSFYDKKGVFAWMPLPDPYYGE